MAFHAMFHFPRYNIQYSGLFVTLLSPDMGFHDSKSSVKKNLYDSLECSSWNSMNIDEHSTSGFLFFFGGWGGVVKHTLFSIYRYLGKLINMK
mgnify:CR=1 FL=1